MNRTGAAGEQVRRKKKSGFLRGERAGLGIRPAASSWEADARQGGPLKFFNCNNVIGGQ